MENNINVLDAKGEHFSKCSFKIANKVVEKGSANWYDYNTIKLTISKEELYLEKRELKKLYKKIIKEEKNICYICGQKTKSPTIDHVISKKNLGGNNRANLHCCCQRCNHDKSEKNLLEYISHIKKHREEYSYISEKRLKLLIRLNIQEKKKEGEKIVC